MKRIIYMLAIVLCAFGSNNLWAYSGGSGTSSSPYLIANNVDLLQLAGNTGDYDKYFKMTSDIDLAGTNFTQGLIGDYGEIFTGDAS